MKYVLYTAWYEKSGWVKRFVFGFVALICSVLTLLTIHWHTPTSQADAQPTTTWLDSSAHPSLEQSWQLSETEFHASVRQGYNPICINAELLTRSFLSSLPLWRQIVNGCWHNTSIGILHSSGNYLASDDRFVAGPIVNIGSSGNNATLKPTPSAHTFLETRTSANTSSRYIKYHLGASAQTSYNLLGNATHTLHSTDAFVVKNSSGGNVWPDGRGLNYSRNGKWAVGATTNYALFRINLETKAILNFGEPQKSGPGWNPFMAVSISEDGRYATATTTASSGGQWMRIYDLQSCIGNEQPTLSLTHAACDYRDVTGFLQSQIPNFHRFTMAEFADQHTLVFYHYSKDSPRIYTRYTLRAPHAGERAKDYIALGDSYASGEGAHDYFLGTDLGKDQNLCHLSRRSYPYLIGDLLKLDSFHSVACSGANTRNLKGPGPLVNDLSEHDKGNQYLRDVEKNELDEWLPGYFLQKTFLEENPPDVVTVSVGGNDLGFADKIKRCLEPDTCYNSYEDRLELLREARNALPLLEATYKELLAASPSAKIYIIGYPKIGNPKGDCAVNVRLDQDELYFAQEYVAQLNIVLQSAAARAGVVYVDIEDVLSGYGFCDGDSRNLAVNGLTAGNDIASVIGNESYHPNARGHQLFAQEIISKTDSFNLPMPAPDNNAFVPAQEDDLVFLNKPRVNREIHSVNYDADIANNIVYRGRSWDIVRKSWKLPFQYLTNVRVVINSEPVELGSFIVNEFGELRASVSIPRSVPTGYHTLHLYGVGTNNQPLDIYKVIYVAESELDKNGDGLADELQPCGVFSASGIDVDQDGIDDACDAILTTAVATDNKAPDDQNSQTPSAEDRDTALRVPPAPRTGESTEPVPTRDFSASATETQADDENSASLGASTNRQEAHNKQVPTNTENSSNILLKILFVLIALTLILLMFFYFVRYAGFIKR